MRTRFDDISDEVHAHRNSPGVAAVERLLREMESAVLKAMAAGTKDQFDGFQGQYRTITRLLRVIEKGAPKVMTEQ